MIRLSLRAVALGSGFFLLGGCGSGGSEYSEYFQILKQSIAGSFSSNSIGREQAAAIPYASLGYRLNNGPENLVVLATDNNGEELWTSGAHIAILTQAGRVKRTVGLPHDMGQLAPSKSASLPAPASALQAPYTETLSADFPDIAVYAAPITCRMAPTKRETITILGQSMTTQRVDEKCESAALRWKYVNSYWLDPTSGFAWRSVQNIHPKGDTLEVEILRPPG